ncbi:MAG TPA: GGDEF domain-containing protein, partial [Bryobacteraceae bacterium]|nr:GGDEF domain-containing protein [Bryobacteraceae bacterium]
TLRENIRNTDIVGRLGGDEFIIAMPGTSVAKAAEVVERIRECFAARDFLGGSGIFHVTCSFGIAELGPLHERESTLLADADRHLYEAKEGGRNRILAMASLIREPEPWYTLPPQ